MAILLFAWGGILASPVAYSQGFVLKYRIDGVADNFNLGYSVAGAGDVNGDGYSDFIIGAPGRGVSSGLALVYSGRTGQLLHVLYGSDGERFGFSVASTGYVNQDRTTDFIIGAPYANPPGLLHAGSVYLYSGATGELIRRINGTAAGDHVGWSVGGFGDVNEDGRADFLVGAPGFFGEIPGFGSAIVYSGKIGTVLYQQRGVSGENLGYSVAEVGDLNGDGRADFIVGAPLANPPGYPATGGSAFVYSGATGNLLFQIDAATDDDQLGFSVAGAGDVDGDGRADFIIGAPAHDPGEITNAGSAFVYSGATGTLLYQKDGSAAGDNLGYAVAIAGDVNGDGRADFLVGSPFAAPSGLAYAGSAFLYSGRDGSFLFQIDGTAAGDQLGQSVAGAGDLDGDGRAEFIVGAPFADPHGLAAAGTAYVFSLPCLPRGDVDLSGVTTIEDAVALLRQVVFGEPLPNPTVGDVNCDGVWDLVDLVLLVQFIVFGSPSPCCL